jgi:hypothetical protein
MIPWPLLWNLLTGLDLLMVPRLRRLRVTVIDGSLLRLWMGTSYASPLRAFRQAKVVLGLSCLARYACVVGGCATPGKACTIKQDAGGLARS